MLVFIIAATLLVSIHSASILERFSQWAETHAIVLPTENTRFMHMFNNWIENDRYIDMINSQNLSYTLGHNHFSAMNRDEFADYVRLHPFYIGDTTNSANYLRRTADVPTSVDWRTKGVVSPVQDQGRAGTCYSFSTSSAVESAYAIKHGSLIKLSEQQIVSCSTISHGGPNMGVNGGQIAPTFSWIGKVGGLCTETDYPYTSGTTTETGTCQNTCKKISETAPVSAVNINANSDNNMMAAIAQQPVSVAIEADQSSFQLYKSGVFTGACGTNLDHAVALVGYGTMNGLDYYILRNSWSETWGSAGYMYIGRGNDPSTGKPYNGGKGQCGVLMQGVYPVL
jgi:C1A family cysteine protease